MKRLIILLNLTLISFSIYSQNFWEDNELCVPHDSVRYTSIVVDTMGSYYLSGADFNWNKGGIYRSDNAGETWTRKTDGLIFPYQSILSLAQDKLGTLYAGGQNSIFKSYNRGDTWIQVWQNPVYATNYNTIRCGYDSVILVGGADMYGIIRSGDHGQSWDIVLDISHNGWFEQINDICFGPNGVIYACSRMILSTDPGKIYASYDQGRTWSIFHEYTYPNTLAFDNQGNLLVGEFTQGIYRYDFSTQQWEHLYITTNLAPEDILVVPDDRIFLACYDCGVMLSDDGGNNYHFINSGFNCSDCETDHFAVDKSGRILVLRGHLYRSIDIIYTNSNSTSLNNEVEFSFATPNPFHFFINFRLESTMNNNIRIFNSIGEIVLDVVVSDEKEYQWNTTNISPGLYIAYIITRKSSKTQKLIHY